MDTRCYRKQNAGSLCQSEKLRLVGYGPSCTGYRLFDEQKQKLIIRRDVEFNEKDFGKETVLDCDPVPTPVQQSSTSNHEEVESQIQQPADNSEPAPVVRKSLRKRKEPNRLGEWVQGDEIDATEFDEIDLAVAQPERCHYLFHISQDEPKTIDEAFSSKESEKWQEAADKEYNSLVNMDTWELVKLPEGCKTIGCRWVFKRKYKEDGSIERYKARLVAKGYSQRYGVDYHEKFSPVVRFDTLRTLLSFAVQNELLIDQMDVTTAFLNGYLDEEIYIEQPPGYEVKGKENLVCKWKRSLYGLKQSSRCWNQRFTTYLQELGFERCESDYCVFVKKDPLILIAVYVDDLVLITENSLQMQQLKSDLIKEFEMIDMGPLHYILGIAIKQYEDGIHLNQEAYIDSMLEKFKLEDAETVPMPADPNVVLCKNDGSESVDKRNYQSIIGSLLYAALATRPDIQFAVGACSRYNSCPTQTHLTAVKRILRYLKATKTKGLFYKRGSSELVGYADADFARDINDRISTSGYVFMLSRAPISWYSGKQRTVSLSTANAEYIALSEAAREGLFLKQMFSEIGVEIGTVLIMQDNQATIAMTRNPVHHKRSKHIDIKYHFVRNEVARGNIKLQYCDSKSMIADILTKPLTRDCFQQNESLLPTQGINDYGQEYSIPSEQRKVKDELLGPGLKIGHINVNGLRRKLAEIVVLVQETGLDILAMTETKLSPDTRDSQIGIDGFAIVRKDRSSNGGGVLLYVKESLMAYEEVRFATKEDNIEGVWINVLCQSQTWLLACIYRPPDNGAFFDAFNKVLEKVWVKRKNILLLGDYNSDFLFRGKTKEQIANGKRLKQIFSAYGLKNIVKEATRISETTQTLIDLIAVSDISKITSHGVAHLGISDHSFIYANL